MLADCHYSTSAFTSAENRDGTPDLLTVNDRSLSLLTGNGNGGTAAFNTAVTLRSGTSPESAVIGDFNGDRKPDIAALDFDGNLSVLQGKGNATFLAPLSFAFTSDPISMNIGIADFNGDGRPDFIVGDAATLEVVLLLQA